MFNRNISPALLVLLVLLFCVQAQAGIVLRIGGALPSGDLKNSAKTGWQTDVSVDFRFLPLPAVRGVLSYEGSRFGEKTFDVGSVQAKTRVELRGAGVGLRLAPPTPVFKPFLEVLVRGAQVRESYQLDDDPTARHSQTKFGYQINGGLQYGLSGTLALEFGIGYASLAKSDLHSSVGQMNVPPKVWSLFLGIRSNLFP